MIMKKTLLTTITSLSLFAGTLHAQTAAETLYNEGIALKDSKNSSAAVKKFKEAIALKPDYTAAYYDMGWCLNEMGEYSQAMTALRKARTVWTTIPKVFFELGYAFEKQGMLDSARKMYARTLELKSDYSQVFRRYGEMAYNKEDYTTTLDNFAKFEQYVKSPSRDYVYWYRKGFSNNALKNYAEAKAALLRSAELKDDHINTWLELGFAATKMKDNDDAIGYFEKAIDIDSRSHIPYNGIAEVYRDNIKDSDKAMEWYRKALNVKTNERKACFGMGYCLNAKGQYSDAISYLETAINQERDYTAAYVELGYSYYMTGRNDDALAKLNKAMEINPQNYNSRYYACLVYVNQGKKAKAQQMIDEMKSLSPAKSVSNLQQKVDKL